MEVQRSATSWIGAIGALLTAIGVIVGAYRWMNERQWRSIIEDVGEALVNEQKMGQEFVCDAPRFWWPLWPAYWIRTPTRPPKLPTISLIVKMGDNFTYTSSAFDMPTSRQEVSWTPFYKGIFNELAWDSSYVSPVTNWFGLFSKPGLNFLLDRGGFFLERWSSSLKERYGFVSFPLRTILDFQCWLLAVLCPLRPTLIRHDRDVDKAIRVARKNTWEKTEDLKGFTTERHLLHQKKDAEHHCRHIKRGNRADDIEKGEATLKMELVKCTIPLENASDRPNEGPFDPFLGPDRSWEDDVRTTWIYDGKPCIEVSAVELAALAFVFGMPIHIVTDGQDRPQSLYGHGAYGISLYGEPTSTNELWRLHFIHGKRDHISQEKAKGSGYSILFARYMGCGCLPFAKSGGWTHVLEVNKNFLEGIQFGRDIGDAAVMNEGPSYEYLYRLPSARPTYYYPKIFDDTRNKGHIYDNINRDIGDWCKAVAHIAFGGLVPMATLPLIQAVRFTVTGGKPLGDGLEKLDELLIKIQRESKDLKLFGKYIEDRAQTENPALVLHEKRDPSKVNIREAAAIFARYTTLLERLIAESWNTTDTADSDKAKRCFDECCEEVRKSYKLAVDLHTRRTGIPGDPRTAIMAQNGTTTTFSRETIGKELDNLIKMQSYDTISCGQIARYIILAWTYYVGVVTWSDNESNEAKLALKVNEEKIYTPVDINKLPQSFILT